MGYSTKCRDLNKRWYRSRCVPCDVKPGYESTPNCGYDDDGSRHEPPMKECRNGTFNDGSSFHCAPCKPCSHGTVRPCNTTTDTECEEPSSPAVTDPPTPHRGLVTSGKAQTTSDLPLRPIVSASPVIWAAPVAVFIFVTLVLLSVYVAYWKRKRGQNTVSNYNRKTSFINAGFSPLSAHPGHSDLQDVLGPNILSAPLQSVLDNLDVLEELVILLDPESHGVKGTKHLASHCNFTSTWVTYTYSMKDTKSPLKAVLEGVTSRHPDWTIGHLAKLLKQIERNDAITVLAKLRLNEREV